MLQKLVVDGELQCSVSSFNGCREKWYLDAQGYRKGTVTVNVNVTVPALAIICLNVLVGRCCVLFQVMPHLLHYLGVEANSKVIDPRQTAGGSTPATLGVGNCMDWGTLAVYTCPASCPTSCPTGASRELSRNAKRVVASEEDEIAMNSYAVSYVEEFVWRQLPP